MPKVHQNKALGDIIMKKCNMMGCVDHRGWLLVGLMIWLFVISLPSGCVGPQVYSSAQHYLTTLGPDDLENYGLALITPSTVTGQEEEKQTVALTFAEVLTKERPPIRCVTLPETLSALNRAGLAEDYKRMFEDYRDTEIFKRDILQKVGEVTQTNYVAQLKLAGFSQGSQGRFSAFGLRLLETKHASIRLFLQIWNSADGTIAWEGVEELKYALDTVTERAITLRTVLEEAARNLIARLP